AGRAAGLGRQSAYPEATAGVSITYLPTRAVAVAQTCSLAHSTHAGVGLAVTLHFVSALHKTKLHVPRPKNLLVQIIVFGHSEFWTQNCASAPEKGMPEKRPTAAMMISLRASGAICIHPLNRISVPRGGHAGNHKNTSQEC